MATAILLKLAMRAHQFDGAADGPLHRRFDDVQRLGGTRQLQQRVDQIGQPVHGDANLQVKLLPLQRAQLGVGQKFGIRQHRREGMPQVMRNGAGHSADRGQPLGSKQALLGLAKAVAHAGEGVGQLGNFAGGGSVHRITEVSAAQRTYAVHQLFQRPGEGAGDEVHQQAAAKNRSQPNRQQQMPKVVQEGGGLVVRLHHDDGHPRRFVGIQGQRRNYKAFLAQLPIVATGREQIARAATAVRSFCSGFSVLTTTVWPLTMATWLAATWLTWRATAAFIS